MGKLTRPLGIMISAISITTFRQIHYLLAGLPSRTAKRCSRMERERKTRNSALLPAEKLTLWVIPFLSKSQAFISSAFTPCSGGRTILNTTDQSPFSGSKSIFLHSLHLCSPSTPIPCCPELYRRTFFLLSLFLLIFAPLFKILTSMLTLCMDFRPHFIGNLGYKTKVYFIPVFSSNRDHYDHVLCPPASYKIKYFAQ